MKDFKAKKQELEMELTKAYNESNNKKFSATKEKLVELCREKANSVGKKYGLTYQFVKVDGAIRMIFEIKWDFNDQASIIETL